MKKLFTIFTACLFVASPALADSDKQYEAYGKIGLPSVNVGVGYGINDNFTVRGDVGTLGRISRTFDEDDITYTAKLKNNKFNLFADYFPFNNGFRVTGGLGFGKTELSAEGRIRKATTESFKIGDKEYTVNLDGSEKITASVKYPAVSPYLGIGWGHNIKNKKAGSWGFTADLGIFMGSPKTKLDVNDSLFDKLRAAEVDTSAAEANVRSSIEAERRKLQDEVGKVKVIPMLSVGATYRF